MALSPLEYCFGEAKQLEGSSYSQSSRLASDCSLDPLVVLECHISKMANSTSICLMGRWGSGGSYRLHRAAGNGFCLALGHSAPHQTK